MNYIVKYFLIFIVFNFQFGTFQRLNSTEMSKVLSIVNLPGETPDKCSQALRGKWYPEIQYTYTYCDSNLIMKNYPREESCPGYVCWESQLTDVTRNEIVDIMNKYRQKVAEGLCTKYCEKNRKRVIYELRWDYQLEINASIAIQNCDKNYSSRFEKALAFYPPDHKLEVYRDTVITSFKSRTGLQREMRLILWRLISENFLNDWEADTWQFRRGLMFDVGCAFVCRREVKNYTTALKETVRFGNVGHLACIFQSAFKSLTVPEGEPSDDLCQKVAEPDSIATEFNEQNYYPLLCKASFPIQEDLLQSGSLACQIHPEDPATSRAKICSLSKSYSKITWNEKYYGLILKLQDKTLKVIPECNMPNELPKFQPERENVYNYYCTLKYEVFIEANSELCSGWNCKDSQLNDIAKVEILKRLNSARHLAALGKCSSECPPPCVYCNKGVQYCNMARVRWHWFLEWKASQFVQNCPKNQSSTKVSFDDGPFSDPVFYEKITLNFDLPQSEGQLALGKTFSKLFWMNAFNDWSDDKTFRRGNALWIGCSIVIRSNEAITSESKIKLENGSPTHMVCIYATYPEDFMSKPGNANDVTCCLNCPGLNTATNPCNLKTVKNVSPFSYLCTSVLFDISMSCQVNYCRDKSVSEIWRRSFSGHALYQDVDGSFQVVEHFGKEENFDDSLTCTILLMSFLFLSLLLFFDLLMIYKYKQEEEEKPPKKFKLKLTPTPKAIREKRTTKIVERKLPSTTRKPTTPKPHIPVPKPKSTTTKKPTTQKPRAQVPKLKSTTTEKLTTQKPLTRAPKPKLITTRRHTTHQPLPRITTSQEPTEVYRPKLLTSKPTPATQTPAVSMRTPLPTVRFEAQEDQWRKKKLLTNPPTTEEPK